jgi:hypothetical protein
VTEKLAVLKELDEVWDLDCCVTAETSYVRTRFRKQSRQRQPIPMGEYSGLINSLTSGSSQPGQTSKYSIEAEASGSRDAKAYSESITVAVSGAVANERQ